MLRTHTCGQLTKADKGKEVVLAGWVHSRRDHGGIIFIDLRDRYGITQINFDPQVSKNTWQEADKLRNEWVIQVKGKVVLRPKDMINPKLKTGEIEVVAGDIQIFSRSRTLPFEIAEEKVHNVNENLRLKYRYLDLRRKRMLNNLILRHKAVELIRDYFYKKGFLEIETPQLIKDTPEGSREYLVPSRIYPGHFYALPQSPQQLKQFLMVGGVDKYFQVARCFRDEDLRGDRQPEFTQFEIEMSFAEEEDVRAEMEKCFIKVTEKLAPQKKIWKKPFPVLTWQEAMTYYGSDKPDLRFDWRITPLTELVRGCGFGVFAQAIEQGGVVHALRVPQGGKLSRRQIDDLTKLVQNYGAKGLAYIIVKEKAGEEYKLQSPIVKFLGNDLAQKIVKETQAQEGDIIFFGADNFRVVCESLGTVRKETARILGVIPQDVFAYVWVVDFPLFERSKETGELVSAHHPFTRPVKEDEPLLEKDPEQARSQAFDLVLNGVEVGGGSMRIHEVDLQKKIFKVLKITEEEAERKFGHLLCAFQYGVPPHGGIAMGLDRFVMLLADEPTIREVMAFPKDGKARDLMLNAPAPVDKDTLKELGLRVMEE